MCPILNVIISSGPGILYDHCDIYQYEQMLKTVSSKIEKFSPIKVYSYEITFTRTFFNSSLRNGGKRCIFFFVKC